MDACSEQTRIVNEEDTNCDSVVGTVIPLNHFVDVNSPDYSSILVLIYGTLTIAGDAAGG